MKSKIILDEPAAEHLASVVAALRQFPTPAQDDSLVINLSSSDRGLPAGSRIEFIVEDAAQQYRLGARRAGWSSAVAGSTRVRIFVIKLIANDLRGQLLGEAEIRINQARPWANAREIAAAAAALIRQGVLHRAPGRAIELAALHPPASRPREKLRWLRRSFVPSLWKSLKWRLGFPERQQWTIGVLPRAAIDAAQPFPWKAVKWITPPSNGLIADPCLIENDGNFWLFHEHMLFGDPRATLHVGQLDPHTGILSDSREVLREPYHLSFPNVFKYSNEWFMLPEQGQSGATRLYKAESFPHQWKHYRDLLPDFPGLDPVLLRHDGKWWLFVTYDASPCVDDNLHLFWSDHLNGNFTPHPLNPIKSGLFGSRMAGLIIEQEGKLIRPAQDGRNGYGHGLVLHEILSLTTTRYAERQLSAWMPQQGERFQYGFHAIDMCGAFAVIDAQQLQNSGIDRSH